MADKNTQKIRDVCQFNESLLKTIPFGLDIVDRKGKILFANEKLKDIVGRDVIGKKCWELYKDDKKQCKDCPLKKDIRQGETAEIVTKNVLDGRIFKITHTGMVYDGKKAVMEIFQDITESKRMEEELRRLSLKDELTSVYNRRGFVALAEHELKVAKRHAISASVLYMDLDNMKRINDTEGHPEGDKALIEFAAVLKKTCRESDIIARMGGDEFSVLAVGLGAKDLHIVKDRLQRNLKSFNRTSNKSYDLSASIGTASCGTKAACSIGYLIKKADTAMYKEKIGSPKRRST